MECCYPTNKEAYEYLYHDHLIYSKKLFDSLITYSKINNVKEVFDASCGTGNDARYFLEKDFEVSGSDLCPEMVASTIGNIKDINNNYSNFFVSDVLDLSKKCTKQYDLVLFRGNTLGHLKRNEQISAIKQLLSIVKKGKYLIFDFRVGDLYFMKRKKYEVRGWGISMCANEFFFSFYKVKHPSQFMTPYFIKSNIYVFNYKRFKLDNICYDVEGNYVDPKEIFNYLKENNIKHEELKINIKGLPFIRSILVKK